MQALLKVHRKGQVTIPARLRDKVGLAAGDYVEARAERGRIVLAPHTAADEYTPEQRKAIDAQLAESLKEVAEGRAHGPFKTHAALVKFLHAKAQKKSSSSRQR